MRISTKLAMAFLAMAATAGTSAVAGDQTKGRGERGNFRFERADADSSGDITYEEFAAAMQKRIGTADKDGDGRMTIAEIASEIERMRAERMARRIVERFDADGDGMLTAAEIEIAAEEDVRADGSQRRRQDRAPGNAAARQGALTRQGPKGPRLLGRLAHRRRLGRRLPVRDAY